jgi:phosphatidylglycerophosphate synthase
MKKIIVNANFDNIFIKICGLTLIERTVLSIFYAGYSEIYIHSEYKNKIKKILDKNPRDGLKISYKTSSISSENIIFNANKVINSEYIKHVIKGEDNKRAINIVINNNKDIKKAEKDLLNSCRKPGEAISSHYYRYFSLFFTKHFAKTKITPNQITYLFLLVGFLGGFLIAMPNKFLYYIGLLMQPLAIVLDCSDGELARIKYKYSKSGEWLDTVCDNLCTLFFLTGIAIQNYRLNSSNFDFNLGIFSISVYLLAVALLFITLIKSSNSGSLNTINRKFKKNGKIASFIAVILKRNVVTLVYVILGFFYLTRTLLIVNMIGCFALVVFSIINIIKSNKD